MLSFQGGILIPSYTTAKSGNAGLTCALANEWASMVQCQCHRHWLHGNGRHCRPAVRPRAGRKPSWTASRLSAGALPGDLKGLVVFLALAASDDLHGDAVDGGRLARQRNCRRMRHEQTACCVRARKNTPNGFNVLMDTMKGSMKTRIGIVGLGGIAQRAYLPVLANLETVDLAVIMSRRPELVEHLRARYHVPAGVTDMSDFLQQDLQAAVVLTPSPTHFEIVRTLLQAGVDVLVEKPATLIQPGDGGIGRVGRPELAGC